MLPSAPLGRFTIMPWLLPLVLSIIAGSVDVIGFLELDGLFTAHITGNLVILAARLIVGDQAPVPHLIAVPVFIVVLMLVRLLAAGLQRMKIDSLVPLLMLQLLLLCAFFAVRRAAGPHVDPNTALMIVSSMLGVSAMAVQNAVVQISLKDTPTTAVMTTNVTRLVTDLGEVLFGQGGNDHAKAGERARRTGLVIAAFVVGCGLGAWCQALAGLWSLALPVGLALVALAIPLTMEREDPSSHLARG